MTSQTDTTSSNVDLIHAARSVVPLLHRDAETADRNSRLTARAARALTDAGLFRLGAPRVFGGHEAGATATLDTCATVGRGCASSAWILTITHLNQRIAACFGPEVREELWGEGADFAMCGSFAGQQVTAKSASVSAGQIVSGRWPMASGALHAQWAAVGITLGSERSDLVDTGIALVPMTALTIEETWNMIGMRGTGSHTLVADGVFVPEHRIRHLGAIFAGPLDSVEPLYRIPLGSLSLMFLGPMLGSAHAAFDSVMELVSGGKPLAMSNYTRLADSPGMQASLADAAALIDTARMHVHRSAQMLDAAAAAGASIDPVRRARVRMDAGYASTCLRSAMELLLCVAGTASMALTSSVQRHWRDLQTAARQPTINPALSREIYGRVLVGNNEPVSYLV